MTPSGTGQGETRRPRLPAGPRRPFSLPALAGPFSAFTGRAAGSHRPSSGAHRPPPCPLSFSLQARSLRAITRTGPGCQARSSHRRHRAQDGRRPGRLHRRRVVNCRPEARRPSPAPPRICGRHPPRGGHPQASKMRRRPRRDRRPSPSESVRASAATRCRNAGRAGPAPRRRAARRRTALSARARTDPSPPARPARVRGKKQGPAGCRTGGL